MKKIITTAMALALTMSMGTTVFAANMGNNSQDVTAKYEKTTTEDAIYNVDLQWGDMVFTYAEETVKTWQPDTHTYETVTDGEWDKTETTIQVTNHSNVDVKVSMAVIPVAGTGVDVTLTGGNATLAAGVEGQKENAASVTGTLKISGTPNETVTDAGIKVAGVTVTIE